MRHSPVQLAIIGSDQRLKTDSTLLKRISGAAIVIQADSMDVALQHSDRVDAAVVPSLHDAHIAVNAGLHVLLNAPFASSEPEARHFIESCQSTGVILAPSGLPRHTPANRMIIDRLKNGQLGNPGLLRIHRWFDDPERLLTTTIFGDVDLAIHLFHGTPTEVYAAGHPNHTYSQIHLGFDGGGMAVLDYAQHLPTGQMYESISLIGSKGAAYSDDHHNSHLLFSPNGQLAVHRQNPDGRLWEIQEFVDCVATGAPPSIDGRQTLRVHHIVDVIKRSLDSAQVFHQNGIEYAPT